MNASPAHSGADHRTGHRADPSADPWAAPTAHRPVSATVTLPGSKSLTNRALLLAAISDGPSVVGRALRSRDTELMAAALTALGVEVDTTGPDWRVTPHPLRAPARSTAGWPGP